MSGLTVCALVARGLDIEKMGIFDVLVCDGPGGGVSTQASAFKEGGRRGCGGGRLAWGKEEDCQGESNGGQMNGGKGRICIAADALKICLEQDIKPH